MADSASTTAEAANTPEASLEAALPRLHLAPSPHLANTATSTRWMMGDVLIALVPIVGVACYTFGWYAVKVVGICLLACVLFEVLFNLMRGKSWHSVTDCSAAVTGVILGLSLPWSCPAYVAVIGCLVAIGLGKAVFGGLGTNLFNPSMVGRAFIMLSFAGALGAGAYVDPNSSLSIVTQATPLSAAKQAVAGIADLDQLTLVRLFVGNVNGSLGETSALALLLGGGYLCLRRSASWEIPASVMAGALIAASLANLLDLTPLTSIQHLFSGSIIFIAFYIATDPVSSPVTPKGKMIFGLGIGLTAIFLRVFSSYPAGEMFAVLLLNACTPLINRFCIPTPVGGAMPPPPAKK